jgi:putative SOS response-associated peptidase YedK
MQTQANELVAPIHERMPVILSGADLWTWLQPPDLETGRALLRPYPAEQMQAIPIQRLVNNPGLDSPEILSPRDY